MAQLNHSSTGAQKWRIEWKYNLSQKEGGGGSWLDSIPIKDLEQISMSKRIEKKIKCFRMEKKVVSGC